MGAGPSHETDWSTGKSRERRPGSRSRLGDDCMGSSGSGFGAVSPCTPRSSILEGGPGGSTKTVFPYANNVDEVKAWFRLQLAYDSSDDSDCD